MANQPSREQQIFIAALPLATREERAAYLKDACEGDAALEVCDLSVGGGGGAKRVVCSDPGTDQAVGNAASIGCGRVCVTQRKWKRID